LDKQEAAEIINNRLDTFESAGYQELIARIDQIEACEFEAPSGTTYNMEIQIFWDDQRKGVIRIMGSIDDGGIRAIIPMSFSRLVAPPE
jgi:hypothetical protein